MLHVNKLKTKERMGRIVAGSSLATFLIIFSLLLTSVGGEKVSAADTTTPTLIESFVKDTTVSLELDTSIANTVSLAPTDTVAAMGQINVRTRVGVTHSDGYQISIQANTRDLVSGDNTIPATSTSRTLEQLDENTWGYGFGNTLNGITYQAPPTTSTIIYEGKGKDISENKEFYLSFGTKVNTTLTPGRYTNSILLSVVSEPATVAGFNGITTMQELTPTICAEAEENVTAYLRDTRDNNYYWVTKLADGNCWMSQNLALNLTKGQDINKAGNGILVSNGSNQSYVPEVTTKTPSTSGNNRFNISTDTITVDGYANSWNEGKWVLIRPENAIISTASADAAAGGMAAFANSSWLDTQNVPKEVTNSMSPRTDYGIVMDVSGSDWEVSKDPNFTAGTQAVKSNGQVCNKIAGWAVSPECKVYDAHYLVGNYYQIYAAVAQPVANRNNLANIGSIETNICPKGWKLSNHGNKSLFNAASGYLYGSGETLYTAPGVKDRSNAGSSPLFLARFGMVGGGMIAAVGANGGYLYGYMRYYGPYTVTVTYQYVRLNTSSGESAGYSVRCVVLSS